MARYSNSILSFDIKNDYLTDLILFALISNIIEHIISNMIADVRRSAPWKNPAKILKIAAEPYRHIVAYNQTCSFLKEPIITITPAVKKKEVKSPI